MSVREKYVEILSDVHMQASKFGRKPRDIHVVAVSKEHSSDELHSAYQANCRIFGESRVQELIHKQELLPKDIQWHMIGTLQGNKVKKIIGHCALIHSVDSLQLAKKISECSLEASITTHILLQVNTSGEQSKHGLSIDEWNSEYEKVLALPNIIIDGLMTIAPNVKEEWTIRKCFADLRKFRDELHARNAPNAPMTQLSMGMTHDYPIAIAEGATLLRIGTAIFGKDE